MIDIHSHVLPGIDDGAKGPEVSVKMLNDSFKQGIRVCAATPHAVLHNSDSVDVFLEKRKKSAEILESFISNTKNEMPKLLYGAEVYLDNDVSEYRGIDKLCISGSPLLLVEFSSVNNVSAYSERLYNLTRKGIVPVLAHVERYSFTRDLLKELSDINVICQLNSSTVAGMYGRRFLNELYSEGIGVVVGSDMHNMSTRRSFMKKAYDKVKKHYPDLAEDAFVSGLTEYIKI